MKKLFFAVILAAFTMISMNAQIKIGAKAGLNIATLAGDLEDTKSLIGFHIGAVAEFEITEQFAFQPELVYSIQGTKQENDLGLGGTIFSGLDDDRITLTYINIPLMLKYYVADSFSLQFGPQIGFLMSANAEGSEDGGFGSVEYYDEDIKDSMKSIDFGLNIGAGYKTEFGLFADVRYNLGLADINDIDGSDVKMKNAVISVSVGYYFM